MGKTIAMGSKQIPHVRPERTMTPEEQKSKIMQFLAQKREQFSISILCNMVQGAITQDGLQRGNCKALVETSVEMADLLMEKLYPMPNESTEK